MSLRAFPTPATRGRILFVDPICPIGHMNLNRVYIGRLLDAGFLVDAVFREGYAEELGIAPGVVKLAMPATYFGEQHGRVRSRWNQLRLLLEIKRILPVEEYDLILFSSYEEISLYLSRFPGRLVLVNHANVAALDNPIKRWFIKRLARRAMFVVFHDFIGQRLRNSGITDVRVVPLGLSPPYAIAGPDRKDVLEAIDRRLVSRNWAHIVFAPTGAKYGDTFLSQLLLRDDFAQYLSDRRILLVVKEGPRRVRSENVLVLRGRLPVDSYRALFSAASCVLISYPNNFTYRVSAVLFECFSNQKPCMVSDIEAFRAFESHFRYAPFFTDSENLMELLDALLQRPDMLVEPYKDLEGLTPSFWDLAEARHAD